MVLIKHIKSSGIAEVVIALAVIAMCFTVASLVFIRTSSAPMKFQDVRKQTEIQSSILMKMYQEDRDIEIDETEMGKETDMLSDSLEVLTFTGSDNRILWQQQWFKK
ncbi:MAG: hypothetical protein K9G40_00165 [Crocinitomicaceae bacterium]|nr:hypothetical protein [Crocinitomicaceae bacterium]MCF8434375.1 hypothetical protein [Crocinitomicaceae bacterium]